jgi:N-acetylmuramoyl-L-alanine amidase
VGVSLDTRDGSLPIALPAGGSNPQEFLTQLTMSANPNNVRPRLTDAELSDLGLNSAGPIDPGLESRELSSEATSMPRFPVPPPAGYAPGHEALQALLAFSSLHEKIRERRARERLGTQAGMADVWQLEQFVLDEVLQLVSERALTLTGADGVAIALVEGNAFVCRASAGTIVLEPGARLDPTSGFSGVCLRTGGIVRCDDSENDPRVNVQVCRELGTRSMVAVPIASSRGTIGLLEAFSGEVYGFNDSDVRSLNLLAELILSAMKPEEENRLTEISQRLVLGDLADSGDLKRDTADAEPAALSHDESSVTGVSAENVIGAVPESAESSVEGSRVADPSAETPIFEAYQKTQKSKSRVGLAVMLLLLFAVAAAAAGMWWKKNRLQPSENQPAPAAVASPVQVPEQIQAAPAAPTSEVLPSSSIQPMRQLVTGIWHVSSPDSSTVIIDLQGEVQYEAHRLADPDRIYFDLHGTALAQGLFGKTIEVGDSMLARVRVAQPRKGVSRIVLETNGPSDFSVSVQSNPYRLVVEIRKAAQVQENALSTLVGAAAASGNDLQSAGLQNTDLQNPGRVGTRSEGQLRAHMPKVRLVLDAGHGGWDLGTVGRKGLMEKDLVLDIVGRLGKLLQNRLGAEIIYTREDDTYLPLEKRTEIANVAQADMFVSVHANYSNDSSARGAETYYTNTYSSVKARTAEADSDASATDNINWNNVDIREKVRQSRRFAVAVQQALHRALATQIPGMRNRGVKKATYVVLTGTSMPAILAEVSFVSSPADEDILKSTKYRQNIAEGLYKGIAQYAATNHHMSLASASPKPKGL